MKVRIISGAIVAILMLGLVWAGGPVLCGAMGIISVIAYLELSLALKVREEEKKLCGLDYIGIIGAAGYYGLIFATGYNPSFLLCFLYIIGIFIAFIMAYVFTFPRFKAAQVIGSFFAFVYAPVMMSFIVLTRTLVSADEKSFYTLGFWAVWIMFISSWGSDTCAYFVGVLLGKHKIFPHLSPKKTVEGCIGGLLGAAGFNYLYARILCNNGLLEDKYAVVFIGVGLIGSVIGQVGDLAASGIKRDFGIKDYGRIIPGHGGIMDRFDSLILMAPLVYVIAINLFNVL